MRSQHLQIAFLVWKVVHRRGRFLVAFVQAVRSGMAVGDFQGQQVQLGLTLPQHYQHAAQAVQTLR